MKKRRAGLLMACGAGLAFGLTTGCTPTWEPSEDEVLFYFRSVGIEGQVRRVWPAGQEYVDRVLKAEAALGRELDKLADYSPVDSLWLAEDPRWRDAGALSDRVDHLVEVLEGHRPARQRLLRELAEVLEAIPAGLETDKQAFVAAAWEALGLDPAAEGLEAREKAARAHLRLCREIQADDEAFDPAGAGLKVTEPARQQAIDRLYHELRRFLNANREAIIAESEQGLAETGARLEQVDGRRQRHEFQYLTDRGKFLRKLLQAFPKDLLESIKQEKEKLAAAQKKLAKAKPEEKAGLETEVAFLKLHIKHLEAERAELKPRIDAIIEKDAKAK